MGWLDTVLAGAGGASQGMQINQNQRNIEEDRKTVRQRDKDNARIRELQEEIKVEVMKGNVAGRKDVASLKAESEERIAAKDNENDILVRELVTSGSVEVAKTTGEWHLQVEKLRGENRITEQERQNLLRMDIAKLQAAVSTANSQRAAATSTNNSIRAQTGADSRAAAGRLQSDEHFKTSTALGAYRATTAANPPAFGETGETFEEFAPTFQMPKIGSAVAPPPPPPPVTAAPVTPPPAAPLPAPGARPAAPVTPRAPVGPPAATGAPAAPLAAPVAAPVTARQPAAPASAEDLADTARTALAVLLKTPRPSDEKAAAAMDARAAELGKVIQSARKTRQQR